MTSCLIKCRETLAQLASFLVLGATTLIAKPAFAEVGASVLARIEPTVIALTKVNEKRVTRTVFEYQYQVTILGGAISLDGVNAQLVVVGPGTSIVDGAVSVGTVDKGSITSPSDTIKIRHDRAVPFDVNAFSWTISGNPPVTASIPSTGGEVEVLDNSSPILGTKISIGSNASNTPVKVEIRYSELKQLSAIGDTTLSPIGKLISINRIDSNSNFNNYVELTLPYLRSGNKTPFVWTRESPNKPFRPVVSQAIDSERGLIIVRTRHFSQWIVATSDYHETSIKPMLESTSFVADSKFNPSLDGFFIVNPAGIVSSSGGGSCTGIAAFASYYFSVAKAAEGRGLADRFKQKGKLVDYLDSEPFDDAIATELASRAHASVRWPASWNANPVYELVSNLKLQFQIATYFLKKGQPLVLTFGEGGGKAGHSVTVYNYRGTKDSGIFDVYDSNYPAYALQPLPNAWIRWDSSKGFYDYSLADRYAGQIDWSKAKYALDSDASIVREGDFASLLTAAKTGFSNGSYLGSISSSDSSSEFRALAIENVSSPTNVFSPTLRVDMSNALGDQIDLSKYADDLQLRILVKGTIYEHENVNGQAEVSITAENSPGKYLITLLKPFALPNSPAGTFDIFLKLTGNDAAYLVAWGSSRIVIDPPPAATVSSARCAQPIVGVPMVCTVTGTNLPESIAFTASNCGPSPMTAIAGGSASQRQYSCTPVTAFLAVNVYYTVPGFTGPLQSIPSVVATNPPPETFANKLTDTGITSTQCRQSGSGALVSCTSAAVLALNDKQDGMIGRDVSSTDNSDGKLGFSYSAVVGGCVKDNVTGLMWEVKTTDGGLRDMNRSYTNYDSLTQPQIWTGTAVVVPTQEQIDASTNTIGYMNAVNAIALCGYSDWRLPTPDELLSIVDFGVVGFNSQNPKIDSAWFPNTTRRYYWTSANYAPSSNGAWLVLFQTGSLRPGNAYSRTPSLSQGDTSVRLVRGAILAQRTYTYTADEFGVPNALVIDNLTGLTWRRCSEGETWDNSANSCTGTRVDFTFEEALAHAKTQAGWRIPNIKELSSLADRSRYSPAIDTVAFPGFTTWDRPSTYWSSTPDLNSQFGLGEYNALPMNFHTGSFNVHYLTSGHLPIRLVR
ncbi:MAG: DUF1566 domain-containing protein [Rhodoferax sp.]|nr:DUF1566 domain-containing protein [Rhodoferax sp.]